MDWLDVPSLLQLLLYPAIGVIGNTPDVSATTTPSVSPAPKEAFVLISGDVDEIRFPALQVSLFVYMKNVYV